MLLPELKEQVLRLSPSDRLALANTIIESLQNQPIFLGDRSNAIKRMRGLFKTNSPSPSDREVSEMLEERRRERYL